MSSVHAFVLGGMLTGALGVACHRRGLRWAAFPLFVAGVVLFIGAWAALVRGL
jgi:hypothetical protein